MSSRLSSRRTVTILLTLVFICGFLPSTSSAVPIIGKFIGETTIDFGPAGSRTIKDTYALGIQEGDLFGSFDPDYMLNLHFGLATVAWYGGPDFDGFADLLTNGTADRMGLLLGTSSTSLWGSTSALECYWFYGDGTCASGIDLAGSKIQTILVETTIFDVFSPGSDPNGDGIWTDYHVLANVGIYGVVPEPSTILLLGSGLIGVAGLARRRKS